MAIYRAPRPESNFYMLDKRISEDKRLSWSARGMLIFLLGKPDHWCVSPAALVNETKGSARASGRDAVYAVLKELIATGYLSRMQNKADGRFDSVDYVVSELACPVAVDAGSPQPDFPDTAQPGAVSPDTGFPDTANPTLVNTDSKQGLSSSKDLFPSDDAGASAGGGAGKKKTRVGSKAKEPPVTGASWDAYSAAYQKRYGMEPLRTGKVNAALKSIVQAVGAERAPDVVRFYLTQAGFHLQCGHDISILVRDIQKMWTAMHRGGTGGAYSKPVTKDDFDKINYQQGVGENGTF